MKHHLTEQTAKERRRLARKMSLALLGPVVGKMPKSSIESLEKLSYVPKIEKHIVEMMTMAEACLVRHDIDPSFPPFFRREAVFGKRNMYVLRDAVVSPHSGLAWIGNRILEESVGSLRRIMDWGDVLHEPLLPVAQLQRTEPVVACHPAGYYHWLLEVLPNILSAVARFPEVSILVPENCPGYITDGLTTILGPEATSRLIASPTPVRVATLVMPQYHTAPEFTHPGIVDLLKSQVKTKILGERQPASGRAAGSKLYVSRRKAGRRRLKGEEVLEQRLRERGFEVLHCEELSFRDQIRIFHEAETVIGTHGAGLSNLVWSEAPCRVIEIFARNYILDCFAWLSFSLGFDYRFVVCKTGHLLDDDAIDAVMALL